MFPIRILASIQLLHWAITHLFYGLMGWDWITPARRWTYLRVCACLHLSIADEMGGWHRLHTDRIRVPYDVDNGLRKLLPAFSDDRNT